MNVVRVIVGNASAIDSVPSVATLDLNHRIRWNLGTESLLVIGSIFSVVVDMNDFCGGGVKS